MIEIIGLGVIGALIWMMIAIHSDGDIFDVLFFGAGTLILFGLIGGVIAVRIGLTQPTVWNTESKTPLVAMYNLNGLEGSFFLASGDIGVHTYYDYWYTDGNGYRHGQVIAGDIEVFEDATGNTATVERDRSTCASGKVGLWSICVESKTRYRFHIPRGSIARSFNLN